MSSSESAPAGITVPVRAMIAPGDGTGNTSTGAGRPRGWSKVLGWVTAPWPERYKPWQGRASRTDKLLMGAFAAVVLVGFAARPIKPFLLASHPVTLEFLTGDLIPIGAAAAFARVGEVSLWLVIVAGAVGMVKFDWLMWWAGRRWGEGILRMFTTNERAQRFAARATELNPWFMRVAVVAAVLPGIPTPVVYAMAGLAGMRLGMFLTLDLVGALLVTGLVAGVGYELGQSAVDVVLVIDRYASIMSLALIGMAFLLPVVRRRLRRGR